jgi:hypothetical protein
MSCKVQTFGRFLKLEEAMNKYVREEGYRRQKALDTSDMQV